MPKIKLDEFFKLESNHELFKQATTPLSCGGDDSFENLAYIGDIFINKVLQVKFNQEGIKNSGELTRKKNEFHNMRTLVDVGQYLEISSYLIPMDKNYYPSNSDIKETVESLIGASLQANGDKIASEIVLKVYEIAQSNLFLDTDYVSILNLMLQKENLYKSPPFEDESPGGPPHQREWKTKLALIYKAQDYHIESGIFLNTTDSRRDASRKMLIQIYSLPEQVNIKQSLNTLSYIQTKPVTATQSLEDHEILFAKSDSDTYYKQPMQSSTNTGENILEWAIRKADKKPFGMLLLLSGKIDDVSVSTWYASTPDGELTLLNLKLDNESYFEVGIGPSKSKSRKDAVKKMISHSDLYAWLGKHYANELI